MIKLKKLLLLCFLTSGLFGANDLPRTNNTTIKKYKIPIIGCLMSAFSFTLHYYIIKKEFPPQISILIYEMIFSASIGNIIKKLQTKQISGINNNNLNSDTRHATLFELLTIYYLLYKNPSVLNNPFCLGGATSFFAGYLMGSMNKDK